MDWEKAVEILQKELESVKLPSNPATSTESTACVDDLMRSPEPMPGFSKKRLYRRWNESSPMKKRRTCEIDEYLELSADKPTEALAFWKKHDEKFPKLAKLARQTLSVPASSAPVERLFSIAGAIARARRANLTAKNIKALIMFKEYLKCFL